MPGMLDPSMFDPAAYGGTNAAPPWLATGQLPVGMLATGGATPAPQLVGGDGDQLPANSSPTSETGEAPVPGTSLLGRIMNGLGRNSNMLMAMGAGLAGAPSLGTGISRGLAGAIPGRNADIGMQIAIGKYQSRYQALVNAGAPPQEALASTYDDKLFDQTMKKYFPGGSPATNVNGQFFDPNNPQKGPIGSAGGELINIKNPMGGPDVTGIQRGGQIMAVTPQTIPVAPPTGKAPVQVNSFEDALRLPPGTPFMTPDGRLKYRPGAPTTPTTPTGQ